MHEIEPGIARVTVPLPLPPGHVHCYVAAGEEGTVLFDTGLALPGLEELFREELAAPVDRIAITHFHPDHVWGGQVASAVTGAPVHQGRLDYDQSVGVWGSADWPDRMAGWFRQNGVPAEMTEATLARDRAALPFIRFARAPQLVDEGDRVCGWDVVELPGHADGHLGFVRDGLLVAGDHLLPGITPAVGVYPESRPDPLGGYLSSLQKTIELDLRLALPGHGDPIHDPSGRARAIIEHHEERLAETLAALGREPRTGYELSLALFPGGLAASQRRFAVAETLAHVERLVALGEARRLGDVTCVTYTAA